MGHETETSVDVVFLTFDPTRDIRCPMIKLDSTCYASTADLETHQIQKRREKNANKIDVASYNHYKWYNSCLMLECQKLSGGITTDRNNNNTYKPKLRIQHWYIESGNIEAFRMQGKTFQAVSMIVSPCVEYWYCSDQGPNALPMFGSRLREQCQNDGKINVSDIRYQPAAMVQQQQPQTHFPSQKSQQAKKSPVPVTRKNPVICVSKPDDDKKYECCSSVLQAIDVLNQKKNILIRGGSPQMHECSNRKNYSLKPIVEEKI
ncbi:uncharacterized protein LOC134830322 [Culicoides brevitarsis]|uniref:uncharacterized protein LOC134830322 n=1 Tax=Culicoides brevitarsis TaxID=469753 RepID=UPI00307B9BCA